MAAPAARGGQKGAVIPVSRNAPVKVVVFQWPCGTPARQRSPRGDRPRRRAIFVDSWFSSMKTSSGAQAAAATGARAI